MDPNQWNAYYGYGQGYEAYVYGAAHDPSLYAYGAYAGYAAQYPQQVNLHINVTEESIFGDSHTYWLLIIQVEGGQDMSVSMPVEESYDPLALPDVDK